MSPPKRLIHTAYPTMRKEPMGREFVVVCIARHSHLANIGYVLPYSPDGVAIQ